MTERQRQFVSLYLDGPRKIQGNATRSAELAGYRWPDKQGPRLLHFAEVGGPIRTERKKRLEALLARHKAERKARVAEHVRLLYGTPWKPRKRR